MRYFGESTEFGRVFHAAKRIDPFINNQTDLARFLGRSKQAITHWIQLGIPETKYYKLADKLKVSVDYIKYGKDKPAKTDITVSPSELDVPN